MPITLLKKFLFTTLLFVPLFSFVVVYANTETTISSVTTTVNINTDGELSITYRNIANPSSINKIVITTYIEKKHLGFWWKRINIPTINHEWIDTIHNYSYIGTRSYSLSKFGTYRITVLYKFYNSNQLISTVTFQSQDSFY